MTEEREFKNPSLEIPDDEDFFNRDFFAYGIFKEGQIAHIKIKKFVEKVETDEIHHEILLRDGVPLIAKEESSKITKGHKIYFIEEFKKDAYEAICSSKPKSLYEWGTVDVKGTEFNALIGVNPKMGSSPHLDYENEDKYLDTFDGSKDPYFTKIFEFIDEELEDLKKNKRRSSDSEMYEMFKLQMNYMLLWSSIDRYCRLKYDVSIRQKKYLNALSKDPLFRFAFKNTPIEKRRIYSSTNAKCFKLDPKSPFYAIHYYYTIRSNIVHRGKDKKVRIVDLRKSLDELLGIFCIMIQNTFE